MRKKVDTLNKTYIRTENNLFKEIAKLPNALTDCDCSHKTYIDTVDYGEMNIVPYVRRTCLECGGDITIEE